jgi:hypothetical protein
MLTQQEPAHAGATGRVLRGVLGVLVGILPGVAILVLNAVVVTGEATLTVGVMGIMATVTGAVLGAGLGTTTEYRAGPMVLGSVLGALPGVAVFFILPLLAPAVLFVGALLGGVWAGQRDAQRRSP